MHNDPPRAKHVQMSIPRDVYLNNSNNIFSWQNWKMLTKNVISKFSVDSNISFTSYAWLCALILLCRQLYSIKSRTQGSLEKFLLFYPEMISVQFLWEMCFLGQSYKKMLKMQILTFLREPSLWNLGVCL